VVDCARRVARSTKRIDEIVTDLLDVSRERQAGGIPITPVDTDVQGLCRVVVDEARTVAAARPIELHCRGTTRGRWDANRITQAVSNLVSNALKHGDKTAPIVVDVVGGDAELTVEVKNAGVIPPELLPRIFDPYRSGTRTDRHGGLGLGLFIVEAIARGHGGRVEVQSGAATGTSFRLVLPRGGAG
jgi:signal transduction histidine kinase